MTREEAIRQLDGADVAVLNREFFKFNQAIIMAISALRTQQELESKLRVLESSDMFDEDGGEILNDETVTDRHQMTNADLIRSMSDEEMAEFISSIPMCVGKDEDLNCEIDVCKECFLKWLQQPAEEADHA